MTRRDEISEQMQQYAICCKDLNEVGNHLQECDDDAHYTIHDDDAHYIMMHITL